MLVGLTVCQNQLIQRENFKQKTIKVYRSGESWLIVVGRGDISGIQSLHLCIHCIYLNMLGANAEARSESREFHRGIANGKFRGILRCASMQLCVEMNHNSVCPYYKLYTVHIHVCILSLQWACQQIIMHVATTILLTQFPSIFSAICMSLHTLSFTSPRNLVSRHAIHPYRSRPINCGK